MSRALNPGVCCAIGNVFFSILVFVFVTTAPMPMTRNALALALACRSETWMESMTRANISARWVAMVFTRALHHCCSHGLHRSTTYTIVAMVLIATQSTAHSVIVQQSRTSNSCVFNDLGQTEPTAVLVNRGNHHTGLDFQGIIVFTINITGVFCWVIQKLS